MSLNSAIYRAASGLGIASRSAEVIAGNVANARTEGYVRRELVPTATPGSGGYGVRRQVDQGLLAERRVSDASAAGAEVRATFDLRFEQAIGLPGDPGSIGGRITAFETALTEAAATPDSAAALGSVAARARDLVEGLRAATAAVQEGRLGAETTIARDVSLLNETLARIERSNAQIRTALAHGRDTAALEDQRQTMIDQIAEIVPLREIAREQGEVALYSTGGAVLLDGRASVITFDPAADIDASVTRDGGQLGGIKINGWEVSTQEPNGLLRGGRLEAAFAVRDAVGEAAQGRLDALARGLIERFSDPAIDPTLAPGDDGAFVDTTANPFDPAATQGIAGRIGVSTEVGGDMVWRWRAGIGATSPGEPGAPHILLAMREALVERRPEPGAAPGAAHLSLGGHAAEMLSVAGMARLDAEGRADFTRAQQVHLRQLEREGGIDTDRELQMLLLVEQHYGANARVVQAVDGMLQRLMEI
jgi:flagellar hook-associated protein 1 FlgK